jgi:hypothetical protein
MIMTMAYFDVSIVTFLMLMCFFPPLITYAVLQPYHQDESAVYLQSWETHKDNARQAMVDDLHYTQRHSVESICAELVPNVLNYTNSTALEHIVVSTSSDKTVLYTELHEQCSPAIGIKSNPIICVIPPGTIVRINADDNPAIITRTINETNIFRVVLSMHALIIRGGKFQWYSTTLPPHGQNHFVMCTGYIAVEQGGVFTVTNGYDPDNSNTFKDIDFIPPTGRQSSNHYKFWIYIRDNGAKHPLLGSRVLGAAGAYSGSNDYFSNTTYLNSSSLSQQTQIIIRDRSAVLQRSWSLLATSVMMNDTVIQCLHDPIQMGWRIGDRIAIAPIADRSQGRAQTFIISSFVINDLDEVSKGIASSVLIELNRPSLYDFRGRATVSPGSREVIFDSSEVINLSRNTIITGDDFTEVPCDPNIVTEVYPGFGTSTEGCMCTLSRSSCTVGLQTVHMYGGYTQIDNVRIEYCGQRGIEGKYCAHFHHLNDCPDCQYVNNAIEYSQQRGIVIHSTHRSTVEANVLFNVRGAAIYLEDGNEVYNRLAYNVAICPWMFEEGGCTLPGTSNDQGDTALNQAGIYMENPTNDLIGNRMVNHFNGIFLNPTNGHGPMEALICTNHMPFGHWEGNTFHSSGRFGTYGLGDNYPLQSATNDIESFLLPSSSQTIVEDLGSGTKHCSILTSDGYDNGHMTTFWNNVDYGNAFVGHYSAGDIQYYGHSSMNNLNNIYWKETKSFQDGCSAHISHSYLVNGTMALPDTIGSFIIEYTTLQQIVLSVNHHCGIGVTGFLCMPHYILDHVRWIDDNLNATDQRKWVSFTDSNDAGSGGIISSSPNIESASSESNHNFFPNGFVSLVSGFYPYLLDVLGYCTQSSDLGYSIRYDSGILCTKLLQTFRIYSNGTSEFPLLLQVYHQSYDLPPIATQEIPLYYRGGKKRGYKFPVLPDDELFYRISLVGDEGNLPPNWFIDFADIAMANRYGVSRIQMDIKGRQCRNRIIESNHDRLFLSTSNDVTGSVDNPSPFWGHGACTDYANSAVSDCVDLHHDYEAATTTENLNSVVSDIIPSRGCPDLCGSTGCESEGSFCHCLLAQCLCLPGRYGSMCEYDLCSECSDDSGCSSKFLGSTISVSYQPCFCLDGRAGEYCQRGDGFNSNGSSTVNPTPAQVSQPPGDGSVGSNNIQFGTSGSWINSPALTLLYVSALSSLR